MKTSIYYLILSAILFVCSVSVSKADNKERSDSKKPEWLANKSPDPSNDSFYYQITEFQSNDLNAARKGCLTILADYITERNRITTSGTVTSISTSRTTSKGMDETIDAEYAYIYKIEGETIEIHFKKMDEYWESTKNPSGEKVYRCSILYAVAKNNSPRFDQITFSRKYGVRGLVRSAIVPGWGQLYKGSTLKAGLIMGGEIAFIGGAIYSENERANYKKKIKETQNITHIRSYSTKADNFETARNIFISGAAAIYIYNLIDAVTANGTKRTIVKKNKFAFNPVVSPQYNGINMVYKF